MGNEPDALSPERICLLPDIHARFEHEKGAVVTFTVRYEEWCCSEAHELSNAIAVVVETIENAAEEARRKRIEKANNEIKEALREEATRREGWVQPTLFDNL